MKEYTKMFILHSVTYRLTQYNKFDKLYGLGKVSLNRSAFSFDTRRFHSINHCCMKFVCLDQARFLIDLVFELFNARAAFI